MTATSELRLFKHSLCCCSLAFCSWFSLFLNWINSPGGGWGGEENSKNQNKWTFRMGDRKQLKREKPSKKSSHVGKLRLVSPEKTLVSLQILQKGKVYTLDAPSPVNPESCTTSPPTSAYRQSHCPVRNRSNRLCFWWGKKWSSQLLALTVVGHKLAFHYLQLLVQAVKFSYSWLVVVVTINSAILQHLQLPGEFFYLWHCQHQLALLLLEQAVHLFNLFHWKGRESTIAALRNSRAWAASKAVVKGTESTLPASGAVLQRLQPAAANSCSCKTSSSSEPS